MIWFLPADQTLALWMCRAYPQCNPWIFGGGNSDRVAAMGPEWKHRMTGAGVPADKVVPTGHPDQDTWYDHIMKLGVDRSGDILPELGIGRGKQVVTLMLPAISLRESAGARAGDISLSDLREDLVRASCAITSLGTQVQLVIKAHPRDTESQLQFLRDRVPHAVIVRDCEAHRLIAASRVVACQWSTTAMIAQAMGTPVIVFDFHQSPSFELWKDTTGLLQATSPELFQQLLEEVVHRGRKFHTWATERPDFLRDYLCFDGKATDRLLGHICELAAQSRTTLRRHSATHALQSCR